jgi:hypothetical protein
MRCDYGALVESTDTGKPQYTGKDLSQRQFGQHQHHSLLQTEVKTLQETQQI